MDIDMFRLFSTSSDASIRTCICISPVNITYSCIILGNIAAAAFLNSHFRPFYCMSSMQIYFEHVKRALADKGVDAFWLVCEGGGCILVGTWAQCFCYTYSMVSMYCRIAYHFYWRFRTWYHQNKVTAKNALCLNIWVWKEMHDDILAGILLYWIFLHRNICQDLYTNDLYSILYFLQPMFARKPL